LKLDDKYINSILKPTWQSEMMGVSGVWSTGFPEMPFETWMAISHKPRSLELKKYLPGEFSD